jgi:hypothetical protein
MIQKTSTINDRNGKSPGTHDVRILSIVLVSTFKDTGIEISGKTDKVLYYTGQNSVIKFYELIKTKYLSNN